MTEQEKKRVETIIDFADVWAREYDCFDLCQECPASKTCREWYASHDGSRECSKIWMDWICEEDWGIGTTNGKGSEYKDLTQENERLRQRVRELEEVLEYYERDTI